MRDSLMVRYQAHNLETEDACVSSILVRTTVHFEK